MICTKDFMNSLDVRFLGLHYTNNDDNLANSQKNFGLEASQGGLDGVEEDDLDLLRNRQVGFHYWVGIRTRLRGRSFRAG